MDATKDALVPELLDYRRQFESNAADATQLLVGLTDTQFNWRPQPGRWSISECLVHLNLTARVYLPVIDQAIARARSRGLYGRGPFRYGVVGRWLIRSMEPPPARRFRAPKPLAPPEHHELAAVRAEFVNLRNEFLERIRRANGLDLSRATLRSPVLKVKILRFRLCECFAFLAGHERRHLWQARQVLEAPGFPKG